MMWWVMNYDDVPEPLEQGSACRIPKKPDTSIQSWRCQPTYIDIDRCQFSISIVDSLTVPISYPMIPYFPPD